MNKIIENNTHIRAFMSYDEEKIYTISHTGIITVYSIDFNFIQKFEYPVLAGFSTSFQSGDKKKIFIFVKSKLFEFSTTYEVLSHVMTIPIRTIISHKINYKGDIIILDIYDSKHYVYKNYEPILIDELSNHVCVIDEYIYTFYHDKIKRLHYGNSTYNELIVNTNKSGIPTIVDNHIVIGDGKSKFLIDRDLKIVKNLGDVQVIGTLVFKYDTENRVWIITHLFRDITPIKISSLTYHSVNVGDFIYLHDPSNTIIKIYHIHFGYVNDIHTKTKYNYEKLIPTRPSYMYLFRTTAVEQIDITSYILPLLKYTYLLGSASPECSIYKFINDYLYDQHLVNEIFKYLKN